MPSRTPCVVWGEGGRPGGPGRPALAAQPSSAAQYATLALAHGDALGVEVLHQRDRILAGDAQEVLHVAGADLLLLLEIRDELGLDDPERLGMEVERLLDPHQPPFGHEQL